jgi:hypothetical protein
VKAALSAMTVKTDRKDARGIAQLIRMGWFQPVHAKSVGAQEIRAHHGGPKSPVPPTMGQISSGSDIYAQEVDVARGVKAKKSRAYRGGPKAVVPHRC